MSAHAHLADARDRLERLALRHSRLDLEHLAPDACLGAETGFDSQALVALMLDVEDEFGVEIDPAVLGRLAGVRFEDLPRALGLHGGGA